MCCDCWGGKVMRNKVKDFMFWILFGFLTLSASMVLFLTWYPYNPITVDKITISKEVVSRGECLSFQFHGEKHYPVPVDVTIELVDGVSYFIMSYSSNNPVGNKFKARPFIIPHHIIPGKYKLRWTGVYTMNALNIVRVKKLSQEFEVR
jgi:hypothetical protein